VNASRRSREHALLIRYLEEARPFFRTQVAGPHPDPANLLNWLRGERFVADYRSVASHLVFCDTCYDLVLSERSRRAPSKD
jgi:hypothetical protein